MGISTTAGDPGFVFLRRPSGGDRPATSFLLDATPSTPSPTTRSKQARLGRTVAQPPPSPAALGHAVTRWLEAREGLRPPRSIRRGPYAPMVIEALVHVTPPAALGARVLALHTQPPRSGEIRMCASVLFDGRVRALAAVLYDGIYRKGNAWKRRQPGEMRAGAWRFETMRLI